MRIPSATYRLQLHADFTFSHLDEIVDYLHALGVDTVYAAPILAARPGSNHGYDGIDPTAINPALGTRADLEALGQRLRERGMGWLQDIVPNHLSFDTGNRWLFDVLERGQHSPYAGHFDIDWEHPDPALRGRLLVPFLGGPPEALAKRRELQLFTDGRRVYVKYFDARYPLGWTTYDQFLGEEAPAALRDAAAALADDPTEDRWRSLRDALHEQPDYVLGRIKTYDQYPGLLLELLAAQPYHLAHWRETERRINFRRFFTVNDLICQRAEDPRVFDDYHALLLELRAAGLIDGFRVDHADGLRDPGAYLARLREAAGGDTYLLVEKILEADEQLPDWPAEGTSGYDFLSTTNQWLTHPAGAERLQRVYFDFIGEEIDYDALVYEQKQFFLREQMAGEVDNLLALLERLDLVPTDEATRAGLPAALRALLASFSVYRLYPTGFPLTEPDQHALDEALTAARTRTDQHAALDHLAGLFRADAPHPDARLAFAQRMQQFTGPLAAKGVEDTTFYRYFPLLGRNEVGDSPVAPALTNAALHGRFTTRAARAAHALNATSTHDTKRGEDARARLAVLSEMPDAWAAAVAQWRQTNDAVRPATGPDANDEYFIYQTLLGVYPTAALRPEGAKLPADFGARLQDFLPKALREAKAHTQWGAPNEAYEAATVAFAMSLIDPAHAFRAQFEPLAAKVIWYGMVNSLSQTLLKVTAPGVPDVYQGTEYWDLSLVDPDNRRPVDYAARRAALAAWADAPPAEMLRALLADPTDGRLKQFWLSRLLTARRSQFDLFTYGEYWPLETRGARADHVLAFARRHGDVWALVALPHLPTALSPVGAWPLGAAVWTDTEVVLPADAQGRTFRSALTDQTFEAAEALPLSEGFSGSPGDCWLSD